jgi:hypothetical protein
LFHGAAFDRVSVAFGLAIDDFFVGQNGAEAGAPVDGDFSFVGEAKVGEELALGGGRKSLPGCNW